MNDVLAVVVTYNRKRLLKENLLALLGQSYKQLDILIIDNASSDGTEEMVKEFLGNPQFYYYNTGKNIGGAGGFYTGMREAMRQAYKYCWIMDDDTIPEASALESLVKKADLLDNKFSFLCSLVKFNEKEVAKMNIPVLNKKWIDEYQLCIENNLIAVDSCSFVSCFVNMEHARNIGLPIKEFFIYGDDVEYTLRLRKKERAYIDLDSIVLHKMICNEDTSIENVEPNKINRAFYSYRNRLFISRKQGAKELCTYFATYFYTIIKILKKSKGYKIKRIWYMTKGVLYGVFFNPQIEIN